MENHWQSSTRTTAQRNLENSQDDSRITLPYDWLLGQQIGILAYALSQRDFEVKKELRRLQQQCQLALLRAIGRLEANHVHLGLLPLSSLHLLSQPELLGALPKESKSKHEEWRKIHQSVIDGRWESGGQNRLSQVNGGRLIAHQILFTDTRASAVAAASEAFLGKKFAEAKGDIDRLEALAAPLAKIRDATSRTADIIPAVMELTSYFIRFSPSWNMVRNALLDHILTWPILVFGKPNASPIGAISIPIALDLSFDGRDRVVIKSDRTRQGRSIIDLNEWKAHLYDASEKGKALWRAKNGNTGHWRDQVLNATTIFDFRIAEELMRSVGLHAIFSDRSMGPYYAQVVLSKAIGRHVGFTTAITGLIGEQRTVPKEPSIPDLARQPDGVVSDELSDEIEIPPVVEHEFVLDWRFSWAGHVAQKKKYIYGSCKFDRLVLPISTQSDRPRDKIEEQSAYVETNHCNYLSGVADCVQIGGWRQFRYVRCPDILHAMHRYAGELPAAGDPKVIECQSLLASATSPILELPERISVSELFAALRDINFIKRLNDVRPAPMASWAVIRTTNEEMDTRFWHLIWRVLGAPRALFDKFKLSQTPQEAAKHLAAAINCLEPTEEARGERAPDLLMILGTKNLHLPGGDEVALVRPLAYEFVMRALAGEYLLPVLSSKLRDFIGRTRIICVSSTDHVGHAAPSIAGLPEVLREIVKAHLVYRFGFTQQMSSVLMSGTSLTAREIREALRELCRRKIATYGGGWYRIRTISADERALIAPDAAAVLVRSHLSAALSFAPYLLTAHLPGLNIANAMLPEHVREAMFHFEEAAFLANKAKLNDLATQARLALQKITRFFEIPTWGVVNRLSALTKDVPYEDVHDMAREMLDELDRHRIKPLPSVLTTVARATTQWWLQRLSRDGQSADTEYLKEQIIAEYERACAASKEGGSHGDKLLLHALTNYWVFLRRHGSSDDDRDRKDKLEVEIKDFIARKSSALMPNAQWFEFFADDIYDHARAKGYYLLGVQYAPSYDSNYIKSLGAGVLSGEADNEIQRLIPFFGEKAGTLLARTKKYYSNTLRHKWSMERWNAGKEFLERNLPR
jgi:hypothetical protein